MENFYQFLEFWTKQKIIFQEFTFEIQTSQHVKTADIAAMIATLLRITT